MGRRVSAARVKANRSYTVEEAAEAVGVTAQTIRSWIKQGLPALTGQRPFLILGWALKGHVSRIGARHRQALELGEFFCLRCKVPTTAAHAIASYEPRTGTTGRLHAFCANCEGPCGRIISAWTLPDWRSLYEIGGNDEG